MKKQHHEILKLIYEYDDVGIRKISSILVRKYNDHRDFYGLVAMLEANYIGFTGPIHHDEKNGKLDVYSQVRLFQAYSQGKGNQTYDGVTIFGKNSDAHLYIGPKGIEYFHNRQEIRRGWYLVATLSFVCSIISGIIVSYFTK